MTESPGNRSDSGCRESIWVRMGNIEGRIRPGWESSFFIVCFKNYWEGRCSLYEISSKTGQGADAARGMSAHLWYPDGVRLSALSGHHAGR